MAFCQKCGSELASGAQFCGKCGTAVGTAGAVTQQGETERKTFFAGSLLKCPSCGTQVDGNAVICPSCGIKLSQSGSMYVQNIAAEIDRINREYKDKKRANSEAILKNGVSGMLKSMFVGGEVSLDNVELDHKKAICNFIDSITIPTSIVDMLDLFVYVKGQVGKTKKAGFLNKFLKNDDPRTAWISLLDSIYEKALITFSNEPEFKKLEEIYRSIRKK